MNYLHWVGKKRHKCLTSCIFFTVQSSDLTASETMIENENRKKLVETLQSRLEEAEQQILDGEKLRKKLHNTILVRNFLLNYPNSNMLIYVIWLFL